MHIHAASDTNPRTPLPSQKRSQNVDNKPRPATHIEIKDPPRAS